MEYEIDYKKIAGSLKEVKAKNVLLQLPDGLKPDFKKVINNISQFYKCNLFIWGNSCFGACDLPVQSEKAGIDTIIHVGHEVFKKR
ncbi:2-(3-amino-3-carboxypropyl)histidine synthase [Candidatus Tiddalikarchaeum anstoanum]|nr:2-(3-amino-3-carboxypropyl)histidine synthase [Candidatus Tiddalikarchaeum anstoanum]